MIICVGRNIYSQELEEVIGKIKGVRKGCVVAFGMVEVEIGIECLVLIVEICQFDDDFKFCL